MLQEHRLLEKYKRSMDIVNNSNTNNMSYGGSNGVGFNGIQSPRGPALNAQSGGNNQATGGGGGDDSLRREVKQFIQSNSCKFFFWFHNCG